MKKTQLQELADKLAKKKEAVQAIFAKYKKADSEGFDLEAFSKSKEDTAQVATLKGEIATLDEEYKIAEFAHQTGEDLKFLNTAEGKAAFKHGRKFDRMPAGGIESLEDYKEHNRHSKLKFFDSSARGEEKAYRFGKFCLAVLVGHEPSKQFCTENGIEMKLQKDNNEGVNADGGWLVPTEFENTFIDLREMFGVFRSIAKIVPMGSDLKVVPRRAGGLQYYYLSEGQTAEEATKKWNRVSLSARKVGVLAKYSSEFDEDSMTNVGDDFAGEIAYSFSQAEDDAGCNGDGTKPYGRITGLRPAFKNLHATRANIAGAVVAAGNLWSEILLTDFEAMLGKLPNFADNPMTNWVCHRAFYFTVMQRVALAAGGTTSKEVFEGERTGRHLFLGYPVKFAQKMPRVEANDDVPCLLGDFTKGVMFGNRRGSRSRARPTHSSPKTR